MNESDCLFCKVVAGELPAPEPSGVSETPAEAEAPDGSDASKA